jgi:hypothetical protein
MVRFATHFDPWHLALMLFNFNLGVGKGFMVGCTATLDAEPLLNFRIPPQKFVLLFFFQACSFLMISNQSSDAQKFISSL